MATRKTVRDSVWKTIKARKNEAQDFDFEHPAPSLAAPIAEGQWLLFHHSPGLQVTTFADYMCDWIGEAGGFELLRYIFNFRLIDSKQFLLPLNKRVDCKFSRLVKVPGIRLDEAGKDLPIGVIDPEEPVPGSKGVFRQFRVYFYTADDLDLHIDAPGFAAPIPALPVVPALPVPQQAHAPAAPVLVLPPPSDTNEVLSEICSDLSDSISESYSYSHPSTPDSEPSDNFGYDYGFGLDNPMDLELMLQPNL